MKVIAVITEPDVGSMILRHLQEREAREAEASPDEERDGSGPECEGHATRGERGRGPPVWQFPGENSEATPSRRGEVSRPRLRARRAGQRGDGGGGHPRTALSSSPPCRWHGDAGTRTMARDSSTVLGGIQEPRSQLVPSRSGNAVRTSWRSCM